MRNLTAAILLIFMLCAVSVNGKDAPSGSADSSLMGKVKNFFGFGHGIFMIVSFVYSLVVAGICFYSLKTILEPKDKDKEDENT